MVMIVEWHMPPPPAPGLDALTPLGVLDILQDMAGTIKSDYFHIGSNYKYCILYSHRRRVPVVQGFPHIEKQNKQNKTKQKKMGQCSASSHVLPMVLNKSASVTCFPLEKYPEAILASISTRESGGMRCSTGRDWDQVQCKDRKKIKNRKTEPGMS